MIKVEKGALHFQKVAEELDRKNTILQNENTLLKSEVKRLDIELQYGIKSVKALKETIRSLQDELEQKNSELRLKDEMLKDINSDIERFGSEVDMLMEFFEVAGQKEKKPESEVVVELLNSRAFGENRDLMFSVNIEDDFLKESSVETIKYYLCSIDSLGHKSFKLENVKLKDRFELMLVARAFAAYIIKVNEDAIEQTKGIIEMRPADIFRNPTIEYWGNSTENIEALFLSFVEKYSLVGELHFETLETEGSSY